MTTIKLTKNEQAAIEYINAQISQRGFCKLMEPRSGICYPHLGKVAKGTTIKALIDKGIMHTMPYVPSDTPIEFERYIGNINIILPCEQSFPENINHNNTSWRKITA